MTSESYPDEVKQKDKEKRRQASAISGGIFLIGLGVLLATGWWWPGIMVVIGLSSGAALIFRGKIWQGIGTLAFFCGIPIVIEIVQRNDLDGVIVGGLILVGIGVIILIKNLFFREE